MKKIVTALLAGALVCSGLSANSLKVVNTFGGDSDSTGGSDLFVFENQKDEEGDYENEFGNKTRVSNRLQLDASGKMYDGRVRVEIKSEQLNGKESPVRLRGYGRFKPLNQLQIIAGNDFSTKVAVESGYLVASDDHPTYARILQNGFGLASKWTFGEEKNIYTDFAAGLRGNDDSFLDIDSLGFDAGFNFGIKKMFSMGATVQNMVGENISAGCFAGLTAIENLTLNAAYIYNSTDTGFLPKAARDVLSLSAGYEFKEPGIFVGLDCISALNNKYISEGESESYQGEDGNDYLVPFFTKARISYEASEKVSLEVQGSASFLMGDGETFNSEVCPKVTYKLPAKLGKVSAGCRLNIDSDGISQFAIPISWKCTVFEIKD